MPGVHGFQAEPRAALIEGKDGQPGDQGLRPAGPVDAGRAHPRRADEIHLGHEHPPGVLVAEQDHFGHDEIHVGGAEGPGETGVHRRVVAGADKVDVGLSVDLRAAQEEHVDAALAGAVEHFAPAVGERVVGAAVDHGDQQPAMGEFTHQQGGGARNRRRGAHRHVPGAVQHAGDHADQELVRRSGHDAAWTAAANTCRSR